MKALEFEREATQTLPRLLADVLGASAAVDPLVAHHEPDGPDFSVDAGGHRWRIFLKSSSSPGVVAAAAERMTARASTSDALSVLLVPFMTTAGAKAAEARGLNWIDLSGNANVRGDGIVVWVQGHPNRFSARGRPASPFAPKSSRVARTLLLDPTRWWRQKDLAERIELDPGRVSRIVRRLRDDHLLSQDGPRVRPSDPDLLLDAWVDAYRFDHHDVITGHLSGSGMELARHLHEELSRAAVDHAFTGLPAAWVINEFAQFRVVSVYVSGDPRAAAERVSLRRNVRGANVQIIGPDDRGVFEGRRSIRELPCVAPVQIYLDLGHLPERATDAAERLRSEGTLWRG